MRVFVKLFASSGKYANNPLKLPGTSLPGWGVPGVGEGLVDEGDQGEGGGQVGRGRWRERVVAGNNSWGSVNIRHVRRPASPHVKHGRAYVITFQAI